MNKVKLWHRIVFIYLLGLALQYLYLPQVMSSPNEILYNLGGDGFFIYYNALFHSCYGDGLVLSGMNYPWGEYIFLTDSMASFSLVFNFLNDLGFPTCEYAIGIFHMTTILLVPLTAVFVLLVLNRLNVNVVISLFASLLICFMSPQLLRSLSHFGLAFPFLIPAGMYWYLRFTESKKLDWFSFFMIGLILFFGINNPYVGFIISGFLALSIFFHYIINRDLSVLLRGMFVSLSALVVIFIVVKFGDIVDDRIKTQWGFFYYGADIKGLFIGEHGLFRKWFGGIIDLPKIKFETQANIGVVAFFVLIISAFVKIFSRIKGVNIFEKRINKIIPFLLAALVMYLYSAHFFIGKWGQPFMEENLGFLTMFKAAGRFIWTSYYSLTILAVLIIDQAFKYGYRLKPYLSIFLVLSLGVIWTMDAGQFIKNKYLKNRYKNPFQYDTAKVDDVLTKHNINTEEYQAMYVLPKMQGWNGKLYVDLDYIAHHHGLITSFRTQIPIINAMLSRMSISQTIQSQQFASPPIVEKELLQHLDMDKNILLLKSNKSEIDEGEQYLVDMATEIHSNKNFSFYTLNPKVLIESEQLKALRSTYAELEPTESSSKLGSWFYHNAFELEQSTPKEKFYGNSGVLDKGEPVLLDIAIPDSLSQKSVEFSIWILVDNKKYGLPVWDIKLLDAAGKKLKNINFNSRYEKVFYHNWMKITKKIDVPEKTAKINVSAKTNQSYSIDELIVRVVGDTILYKAPIEADRFMFNNFIIEHK